MYFKIALGNVKKSLRDYSIYFLTLAFGVCIFYAFSSIGSQSLIGSMSTMQKSVLESLNQIIGVVSVFISVVLGLLIVYANRYLIRRRKKEFGIYLTLGMERSSVSWIIILETFIIGLLSLAVGLLAGIILSQGLSILAAQMFEVNVTTFHFTFSSEAFVKTIIYFGLAFVVVILFSVFSVGRLKLIDLMQASKVSETLKARSLWVAVPAFILSLVCIGAAYSKLQEVGLLELKTGFLIATVLLVVGTFLFFFSLSGFLLKAVQLCKPLYLRNLNAFSFRQLNSKINTAFISISVICLMLFLAISIFAGGMGLVRAENRTFEAGAPYDATLHIVPKDFEDKLLSEAVAKNSMKARLALFDADGKSLAQFQKLYAEWVEGSVTVEIFHNKDFELKTFFPKGPGGDEKMSMDGADVSSVPIGIVPLSSFNKAVVLQGGKEISLGEGEYAITSKDESYVPGFNTYLEEGKTITIGDITLHPEAKTVYPYGLENDSAPAFGLVVVPDSALTKIDPTYYALATNLMYKEGLDPEVVDAKIQSLIEAKKLPVDYMMSKPEMKLSAVGGKIMISYLAVYIGFVLLVTCAAILALQQLSEASDNVVRYSILSKIGADSRMISHALFVQVAIYFFAPLGLALVHSYVALNEVRVVVGNFGGTGIMTHIMLMGGIILVIYLVYFFITFISARGIIQGRPKGA